MREQAQHDAQFGNFGVLGITCYVHGAGLV